MPSFDTVLAALPTLCYFILISFLWDGDKSHFIDEKNWESQGLNNMTECQNVHCSKEHPIGNKLLAFSIPIHRNLITKCILLFKTIHWLLTAQKTSLDPQCGAQTPQPGPPASPGLALAAHSSQATIGVFLSTLHTVSPFLVRTSTLAYNAFFHPFPPEEKLRIF